MSKALNREEVSQLGTMPLLAVCCRASWRALAALDGELHPIVISGRTDLTAAPVAALCWAAAHIFGTGASPFDSLEPARRRTLGAAAKVAHNGGGLQANAALVAVVRCASTLCLGDHWGCAVEAYECLVAADRAWPQRKVIGQDIAHVQEHGKGTASSISLLCTAIWPSGKPSSWQRRSSTLAEQLRTWGHTDAAEALIHSDLGRPELHAFGRSWAIGQRISEAQEHILLALREGETRSRDFKGPMSFTEKSERLGLMKDIAAMANTPGGGEIIIGIEEKPTGHEPVGLSDRQVISFDPTKIGDNLANYFGPAIEVGVRQLTHVGRTLVMLVVAEFRREPILALQDGNCTKKLHFRRGDLLVRTAKASTQRASPEEFRFVLDHYAQRQFRSGN